MNKLVLSLSVIVAVIVLTGCPRPIVPSNYIKYETLKDSLTILALDPVIQKNDILSINVSTAGGEYSQNLIRLYNPNENQNMNQANLAMTGFLVSPKGTITVPSLGEVEAAGKTKQQLIDDLYERYKKYLKIAPIISVRIINFKIFIEGEVARPGYIDVSNEVISLQQAIAVAGGTTLFAQLNDVVIYRDDNGKKRIVHIDLRNDELFTKYQDFFYLKQNDYISIKANKEKIISSNQSTSRTISYATTAVTILLTLFTLLRN